MTLKDPHWYLYNKNITLRKIFNMKIKNIIFIFYFIQFQVHGFKIIPLGTHCSAASSIRQLNIRQQAFPLDWIVSDFNSLYKAFEEDFKNFLNIHSLRLRPDKQAVVDYYGFQFPHDFPTTAQPTIKTLKSYEDENSTFVNQATVLPNFIDYHDIVFSKYARRINRMYDILKGSEKVYFLRHFGINKQQAIAFRNLISKKFPQLDFVIVVVNSISQYESNWNLEKIKNHYLDDRKIWNNPEEWKRIYSSLGLMNKSLNNLNDSYTEIHRCIRCSPIN